MSMKQDRKRTANAVLPKKYKGRVDRREFDISGYDTKNGRLIKSHKVYTGVRGGKFIIVRGAKRYL